MHIYFVFSGTKYVSVFSHHPPSLAIALTVSFVINLFVICVFGAVSRMSADQSLAEVVDGAVFMPVFHLACVQLSV